MINNESKVKVSIVVPVYNVEQYLKRCVDSILKQTEKALEIILVDDGSTDESGRICDEYAARDGRIQVIHKQNGGLTSAWKAGASKASGAYIGFVDSDDWIDPDMFSVLYGHGIEHDADLVICGLVFEFEDNRQKRRKESSRLEGRLYDRAGVVSEIFPSLFSDGSFFGRTIQPARVTKLYKRQILLDNMSWCSESVSIGEDMQITFPVLCDARRVYMAADFYPYHYWIHDKSMTGRHDSGYVGKIAETMNQLLNISVQKNVYDFSTQIVNDFLCLAILGIKSEIMKNYKTGVGKVIKNLKHIFNMPEIREALSLYRLPGLGTAEKLYIMMIRHRLYRCCFLVTFVFFKLQEKLSSHKAES